MTVTRIDPDAEQRLVDSGLRFRGDLHWFLFGFQCGNRGHGRQGGEECLKRGGVRELRRD